MLLSQIRQPAPLLPFLNVDMPTSAPRETSHTPPLSAVPPEEVQRLSEFAADGRSLKTEWQSIIDDSTKRLGKTGSSRCRVTVTDRFGGRGHDFQVIDSGHNLLHAFCDYLCTLTSLTFTHSPLHGQVVDKESNSNGGMLVIATSMPNEREWIQWKGRTARQDRPGQFYVVLNKLAKPFTSPKQKKLVDKLKKLKTEDEKMNLLLEVSDEG